MHEAKTALIRYVFLDIVNFSIDRSVEAQSEIIQVLNQIVIEAVGEQAVPSDSILYFPTGDGICICMVNLIDPYDLHVHVALDILRRLEKHSHSESDVRRRFKIRVGINENQDNLIVDINGQRNVAGLGINAAQRIMSLADPLQINVGESVYERLSQREAYSNKFRKRCSEVKHGLELVCYQYVNSDFSYLDSRVPGKPQKDTKIPRDVVVYHALLSIFKADIEKHYGSGSRGYSLVVVLCFIALDYLKYADLDGLERRMWSSLIFDKSINGFSQAFSKIDSGDFWTIVKARDQCRRELSLDTWGHLFKMDLVSENRNYTKMVAGQWPGLQRRVAKILSEMYPWYNV